MPESIEIPIETLEPLAETATDFVEETQESFDAMQESLAGVQDTLKDINSGISTLSNINTYEGNKEQTVIQSFQNDGHVYLYASTNQKNFDDLLLYNSAGQYLTAYSTRSGIYDIGTVEQVLSNPQGYYAVARYEDYKSTNNDIYYVYSNLYVPAESLNAVSSTLQTDEGVQVMTRDEMLQGLGDFSFLMIAIVAVLFLNLGVNLFRSFRSR